MLPPRIVALSASLAGSDAFGSSYVRAEGKEEGITESRLAVGVTRSLAMGQTSSLQGYDKPLAAASPDIKICLLFSCSSKETIRSTSPVTSKSPR